MRSLNEAEAGPVEADAEQPNADATETVGEASRRWSLSGAKVRAILGAAGLRPHPRSGHLLVRDVDRALAEHFARKAEAKAPRIARTFAPEESAPAECLTCWAWRACTGNATVRCRWCREGGAPWRA